MKSRYGTKLVKTEAREEWVRGKWAIFYYFQARSKTGAGPGNLKGRYRANALF